MSVETTTSSGQHLLSGYNVGFLTRKQTMNTASWSKAIKERDGKCMDCGTTESLHAHHILPKSTHPELRLELSNGKTLCYACHKKEHERTRPLRPIRDVQRKPQRRTLERRILKLEAQVKFLERQVKFSTSSIDVHNSYYRRHSPSPKL